MPWAQENMSLVELASSMGNAQPGSVQHTMASAEFMRRQTIAQVRATRYMLWSVIAIAITSGVNAIFAFLIWYAPRIPH